MENLEFFFEDSVKVLLIYFIQTLGKENFEFIRVFKDEKELNFSFKTQQTNQ